MSTDRPTPGKVPPVTLIRAHQEGWVEFVLAIFAFCAALMIVGWPLVADPYPRVRPQEKTMKTRNLELTNAGQEYAFTFSQTTVWFTMQARTSVDVRWATDAGNVASATNPYATLKAGTGYDSRSTNLPIRPGTSLVLYFASATAGTVVEIVEGY